MPADIKKLQGEWLITSLHMDGQKSPDSVFSDAKIIVKGTKFTSITMGTTYKGSIELDETKSPKAVDLNFTAGPEKGCRNLGIYELEGDTWKLCLATRGPVRPKNFSTKPGDGVALEILKRESAATNSAAGSKAASAKTKPAKPSKKSAAASGPATELEGEWQMLTAVMNGQPLEKQFAAFGKRVTRGNETTVFTGPQMLMKVTFTLDRSKFPNEIDYVIVQGMNAGKTQLGIFELNGPMLKLCFAAPGNPRPDAFSSAHGDSRTFTTWRKK
jgi:uncharacterized protein (TIGR03067 family)